MDELKSYFAAMKRSRISPRDMAIICEKIEGLEQLYCDSMESDEGDVWEFGMPLGLHNSCEFGLSGLGHHDITSEMYYYDLTRRDARHSRTCTTCHTAAAVGHSSGGSRENKGVSTLTETLEFLCNGDFEFLEQIRNLPTRKRLSMVLCYCDGSNGRQYCPACSSLTTDTCRLSCGHKLCWPCFHSRVRGGTVYCAVCSTTTPQQDIPVPRFCIDARRPYERLLRPWRDTPTDWQSHSRMVASGWRASMFWGSLPLGPPHPAVNESSDIISLRDKFNELSTTHPEMLHSEKAFEYFKCTYNTWKRVKLWEAEYNQHAFDYPVDTYCYEGGIGGFEPQQNPISDGYIPESLLANDYIDEEDGVMIGEQGASFTEKIDACQIAMAELNFSSNGIASQEGLSQGVVGEKFEVEGIEGERKPGNELDEDRKGEDIVEHEDSQETEQEELAKAEKQKAVQDAYLHVHEEEPDAMQEEATGEDDDLSVMTLPAYRPVMRFRPWPPREEITDNLLPGMRPEWIRILYFRDKFSEEEGNGDFAKVKAALVAHAGIGKVESGGDGDRAVSVLDEDGTAAAKGDYEPRVAAGSGEGGQGRQLLEVEEMAELTAEAQQVVTVNGNPWILCTNRILVYTRLGNRLQVQIIQPGFEEGRDMCVVQDCKIFVATVDQGLIELDTQGFIIRVISPMAHLAVTATDDYIWALHFSDEKRMNIMKYVLRKLPRVGVVLTRYMLLQTALRLKQPLLDTYSIVCDDECLYICLSNMCTIYQVPIEGGTISWGIQVHQLVIPGQHYKIATFPDPAQLLLVDKKHNRLRLVDKTRPWQATLNTALPMDGPLAAVVAYETSEIWVVGKSRLYRLVTHPRGVVQNNSPLIFMARR